MDPSLMDKMFTTENGLGSLPTGTDELSEESKERLVMVLDLMERISPIEADMIELHLLKGVSQAMLGKIFGYTQPNVHYRVERGKKRLKALLEVPVIDPDEIRKRLSGFISDEKDIEVMVLIYQYSSQSKVALLIGESQGKVRYRFLRCLKSLSMSEINKDLYFLYKIVEKNLTLLRKSEPLTEKVKTIL